MWPWEHLAVGYLAYSLYVHARSGRAPRGWPVVAVAVGTQFPDLVDKPLAWTLGVLPTGQSLAHSLLFAVPLSMLAVTAAAALGRTSVGTGFAVGYLSHLPGDAFYPLVLGGEPKFGFLLWPLVSPVETEASIGFAETVRRLFARYVTEIANAELSAYLVLELSLILGVFAVWVYDGMPPLRSLWSACGFGRPAEEAP